MPDDLAGNPHVSDLRLDRLPGCVQILRDLRQPERLPAEVRGGDGLCDEADLLAVDAERSAARLVASALEDDARQAKPCLLLVARERFTPLEVALVEVDAPPEPALERRD